MSTDEQKGTRVVSQGSSAIAKTEEDEVAFLLEGRPYFRVLVLLFTVALLYAMRSSLSPFLVGGALLALLVFVQRGVSFELGIGLVVILLLLVWFLDELTGLLWPFVTSFVLAYLIAPLVEVMERWISRTLAIGLVVVLLLGALASVGVVLVPLVIEEVGEFVAELPRYGRALEGYYKDLVAFIEAQGLAVTFGEIQDQVLGQLPELGKLFAKQATSLLQGLTSGIAALLNLALIPFVTFYVLKDFERIKSTLRALLPRRYADSTGDILGQMDEVLGQYVRGQFLVCGFIAILTTFGLAVSGIRYAVILGLIAGISNLVPYVGLAFSLGLTSLIVLLDAETLFNLVKVIAVFVVVQGIEGNFLSPKVVGERVGLHPAWVMFALVIAAHFWGFVGMVVAIPVAAIMNVLVKILTQRYYASRYYELK